MLTENWQSIGNGSYHPSPTDLRGFQLLQDYWYQFLKYRNPTHRLNAANSFTRWLPIDQVIDWPNNYSVMSIRPSGPMNSFRHRNHICAYNGLLGIGDEIFWWSN